MVKSPNHKGFRIKAVFTAILAAMGFVTLMLMLWPRSPEPTNPDRMVASHMDIGSVPEPSDVEHLNDQNPSRNLPGRLGASETDSTIERALSDVDSDLRHRLRESEQRPSPKERWFKAVEEETLVRLEDISGPQTVHGRVEFSDLIEESAVRTYVYARDRNKIISASGLVDGRYSLGALEPGAYTVYVQQTDRTPGITKHTISIEEGQNSVAFDFEKGECSLNVRVVGPDGAPFESATAVIVAGGTDDDLHAWRRQEGIEDGAFRADHLFEGQYVVTVIDGPLTAGSLTYLKKGENQVDLRLRQQPAEHQPKVVNVAQ